LAKVGTLDFKATGKQIIEPGWRVVYADDKQAIKGDEERTMPHFDAGEMGPHEPIVHKGKTSAPKPYTEATLLRAMETAGKQVEDENLRELMKDNGIGRPSTRANIIETLFRRKYIEKNRKNILATATGMDLIDTIQNDLLKSPELTGNWERKIRLIEKGEYQLDTFKQELYQMVRELTDEVIFNSYRKIEIHDETVKPAVSKAPRAPRKPKEVIDITTLVCPKCKSAKLMIGKTAVGCSNYSTCGFKVPFELSVAEPKNAEVPALDGAIASPAGFMIEADGSLLSVAQLNSPYPIAPTFFATPAATAADPDAPWKLKKPESGLGVVFAKVPDALFGQIVEFETEPFK
jgi:DNA topoisomerase-3